MSYDDIINLMANNNTLYEDNIQSFQKIFLHGESKQGDHHNKFRHTNICILWKNGEQPDTMTNISGYDASNGREIYILPFPQTFLLQYDNHEISDIMNKQHNKFTSCWNSQHL